MRKKIQLVFAVCMVITLCVCTFDTYASNLDDETVVSGIVTDMQGEPLAGVNIRVEGKVVGTSTRPDGTFDLAIQQDPPLTLVVSIVGFQSRRIEINDSVAEDLEIQLEEETISGGDLVVSASRVEQSILKSPVSIEKMDVLDIQTAASPSFYDAIANLQGVDFSSQSITFKSINTRGFGANGNTRFVQLIDGIDNQAPGLNFSVGNIVGISELDLESAELIPGAASALYGPNALNGILLMNSKSPFEYQGLSFNIKQGVNHVDSQVEDASLYHSYDFRYGNAVNNKFAYKVTASYLRAQDFVAQDYRDQSGIVERGDYPRDGRRVFDGVNIYGDGVLNLGAIADGVIAGGGAQGAQIAAIRSLIPDGPEGNFSAPGFRESEFVDNTTESLKLGTALHYRLNDSYELLGQYNIGFGSTVYTANDRFVLDDFNIWTAKVELRNPNFFLRAYTTQEDAGDTYAANTVATRVNQLAYITPYFQTFAGARTQGATVEQAHQQADAVATAYQQDYLPGTQGFANAVDSLRALSIAEGGALFLDKSNLYHAEGMYNLSNVIDPSQVEVIVGANYRIYDLNSEGTLFAYDDVANQEEFNINEWGAYVQASKSFLDDDVILQGSLRYDKNEYFDGQLSPRISATFTVADDHNFRASYQTGFRIPTTQDQFINLDVVSRLLIGSNQKLVDRYRFETNRVYTAQSVREAQEIANSGGTAQAARDALEIVDFEEFDTEKVETYEVGYKSLLWDKLMVDAYYYYSSYTDFIAEIQFIQGVPNGLTEDPGSFDSQSEAGQDAIISGGVPTQEYGFDVNADGAVNSHGWGFSLEYALPKGFLLGGNVSYNNLLDQDALREQGFRASYNTPEWRYNVNLANRNVYNNIGFNATYRWQDAMLWESSFGSGIVPAFGTLDAQVSYKLSDYNTILKLGGSNVLNERYTTSFGNPLMGAIYYFSLTFDQFLN
ncbi:MAG TPA: TonB-dependent receptor [Gracilimonas sp.]|uniref:TonB-dependent receptor n=1 Tax=Gracilimonas sp. TaxID=1974203 RepID=UPI002D8A5084|nr:TonB-dependent receptor [Gracilimonas sp.]